MAKQIHIHKRAILSPACFLACVTGTKRQGIGHPWPIARVFTDTRDRIYLETSLETNRRIHWSEEGVAYAHFRLAKVLQEIGEYDKAAIHKSQAATSRDKFLKAHPEYLEECPHNEVAIYDQMISIWSGRCTYRTKDERTTTAVESRYEIIDLVEDVNHDIEEI